jgi:hypothetical protein
MSYWENLEVNLGIITAGKAKKVEFKAKETMPKISELIPACGCTELKYDEKKRILYARYSNGKISPQVVGPQSISKTILVKYVTGENDLLTIKAVKIR